MTSSPNFMGRNKDTNVKCTYQFNNNKNLYSYNVYIYQHFSFVIWQTYIFNKQCIITEISWNYLSYKSCFIIISYPNYLLQQLIYIEEVVWLKTTSIYFLLHLEYIYIYWKNIIHVAIRLRSRDKTWIMIYEKWSETPAYFIPKFYFDLLNIEPTKSNYKSTRWLVGFHGVWMYMYVA